MRKFMVLEPHLHALALLAGERGLHHAVILPQRPWLVNKLDIVTSRGGDTVGSQGVFAWRLGGPLGVVDVENHVTFAHVKVPGDDWGGVNDLNEKLFGENKKTPSVTKSSESKLWISACEVVSS